MQERYRSFLENSAQKPGGDKLQKYIKRILHSNSRNQFVQRVAKNSYKKPPTSLRRVSLHPKPKPATQLTVKNVLNLGIDPLSFMILLQIAERGGRGHFQFNSSRFNNSTSVKKPSINPKLIAALKKRFNGESLTKENINLLNEYDRKVTLDGV